ncbi:MAG: glycerophosphodiester phosphodiesterase [Clostridia bacterium]|nr:glycerophosphodiester phosphodiesterase [Clostridia bacterium]
MAKSLVISHRGANRYAPQNTLPAFEKGYALGADGFETDVHITKDGKIVLCHNYTIDETSDGCGEIANKTLADLKGYDFGKYFSDKFKGTEIPTIDEFLSFVATTDITVLNIEIKSPKQGETAIVSETIKAVKEHGLFDKLLISSFDPKLLVEAKKIDKNCKTGFLYAPNHMIFFKMALKPVAFAKEIGADALHPFHMLVDEKYVKNAQGAGIMVNPWTVNKEKDIDKMIKLGVDGIITDFPDVVSGKLSRF